jgi:hypothetical protein
MLTETRAAIRSSIGHTGLSESLAQRDWGNPIAPIVETPSALPRCLGGRDSAGNRLESRSRRFAIRAWLGGFGILIGLCTIRRSRAVDVCSGSCVDGASKMGHCVNIQFDWHRNPACGPADRVPVNMSTFVTPCGVDFCPCLRIRRVQWCGSVLSVGGLSQSGPSSRATRGAHGGGELFGRSSWQDVVFAKPRRCGGSRGARRFGEHSVSQAAAVERGHARIHHHSHRPAIDGRAGLDGSLAASMKQWCPIAGSDGVTFT